MPRAPWSPRRTRPWYGRSWTPAPTSRAIRRWRFHSRSTPTECCGAVRTATAPTGSPRCGSGARAAVVIAPPGTLRYNRAVKIAPSILSADFAALADDIARVEAGQPDQLHVDVMDGRFVPNLTIGPVVVSAIRKRTRLPLDCHLMIVEPERYVGDFVAA